MRLSDFDYELPAERIAQAPAERRDHSRLLVLDRETGAVAHQRFDDLAQRLGEGDLLVVNDTRVRKARLGGRKASGGRVELLLVEPVDAAERDPSRWRCLLQSSRRPRVGSALFFEGGLKATIVADEPDGWIVDLQAPGPLAKHLASAGHLPLPPYIHREAGDVCGVDDDARYQTVYAKVEGAVAAPTAGLHFTDPLLDCLRARGVAIVALTLHVGPGTFLPVRSDRIDDHSMHAERYVLPGETVAAIEQARAARGRVVAVGTTAVRVLEHCAAADGKLRSGAGSTDLFIRPGFRFRVVDALITNFHLPRSTLLMLVSAFAGRERLLAAYREAVDRGYRFYSYGDAMLIEGRES